MAEPFEILAPSEQLAVRTLKPTGWIVPPGWYGKVDAAGTGIVRRDGCDTETGLSALEELGGANSHSLCQPTATA